MEDKNNSLVSCNIIVFPSVVPLSMTEFLYLWNVKSHIYIGIPFFLSTINNPFHNYLVLRLLSSRLRWNIYISLLYFSLENTRHFQRWNIYQTSINEIFVDLKMIFFPILKVFYDKFDSSLFIFFISLNSLNIFYINRTIKFKDVDVRGKVKVQQRKMWNKFD